LFTLSVLDTYIILSAFLASYNPAKYDKIFIQTYRKRYK
jgi:hypothetical protein